MTAHNVALDPDALMDYIGCHVELRGSHLDYACHYGTILAVCESGFYLGSRYTDYANAKHVQTAVGAIAQARLVRWGEVSSIVFNN